jgi:hypothetical protein
VNTIFSISNQLAKSTKLELSRLTDASGQNPGVQPINTHSKQIAWQFQLFKSGNSTVVIVIESYSRYILLLPFYYSPTWEEVKGAFYEQWFGDMQSWLKMGGFVRSTQQQTQLEQQFQAQSESQIYRNLDRSIGGHMTDTQFWIRDYMEQMTVQSFDQQMAKELSVHINNQSKRVKDVNGKKSKFSPLERFLDDSLYRYAQGLCDQFIPGCAEGNFPNPHKRAPKLTVV